MTDAYELKRDLERQVSTRGQSNRREKQRRLAVFERDGWECRRCRTRKNLTVDHIKPRSAGGTHDLENLQTLCQDCNQRKADRWETA